MLMIFLSSFLYLACATAYALHRRVVFDPPILYPNAGTVWSPGETHDVVWSIADAPAGFPLNTATGMIVLGFDENNSENLDLDNPLASGFLIKSTRVPITVPTVPFRTDYIVVLFGDSGNASPEFTIKNITISDPPPTTSFTISSITPSSAGLSTAPLTTIPTTAASRTITDSVSTQVTSTVIVPTDTTTVSDSITTTAITTALSVAPSNSVSPVASPSSFATSPTLSPTNTSAVASISSSPTSAASTVGNIWWLSLASICICLLA